MAEKSVKIFPFTAITGQDDLKLALALCAIDPQTGGVLARGEKGTGKTTAVRSLGDMLSGGGRGFPVINLPIGATEDRVLGAIDLEKLINEKRESARAGLLEQANGGILYIDEVNLLDDYLTDILLDAAATGEYMLERDGISRNVKTRFRLVGTMNLEEGDLRPQLLDRFGLCVDVKAPASAEARREIAQNRMGFDSNPEKFSSDFEEKQEKMRERIEKAAENLESVKVTEEIFEKASALAIESGAEGMRADILIVKSARAFAAFEGRDKTAAGDVEKVAPFVLRHRSPADTPADKTEKKNSRNPDLENGDLKNVPPKHEKDEFQVIADSGWFYRAEKPFSPEGDYRGIEIDTEPPPERRGRFVSAEPAARARDKTKNGKQKTDIYETARQWVARGEFKIHRRAGRGRGNISVVFLVDSSGSMAAGKQIAHAKKIIGETVRENRGKKVEFSGVALVNDGARVFSSSGTDSGKLIENLKNLKTGGRTNMSAGIALVGQILKKTAKRKTSSAVHIFTDGRINFCENGGDPFEESVKRFGAVIDKSVKTTVVDTESGFVKIGAAKRFADKTGASYARADMGK